MTPTPEILESMARDMMEMASRLAPPPSPTAELAQRWLDDCEVKGLSERTLVGYRQAAALLVSLPPDFDRSDVEIALKESGSKNCIGGAVRTALRHMGLGHMAPRGRVWRFKPDANAFAPDGYVQAVDILLSELPRAFRRGRHARARGECAAFVSTAVAAAIGSLTGLRAGELVSAQRSWWAGDVLRVEGKVGPRWIPLSHQAQRLLACASNRGTYLFPSREGADAGHIAVTSLGQYMRRLRVKHGQDIPALRPQALRHAYACYLIDSGFDLVKVASIMGHSVETCLRYYARPRKGAQAEAVQAVADMVTGQTSFLCTSQGRALVGQGAGAPRHGGGGPLFRRKGAA